MTGGRRDTRSFFTAENVYYCGPTAGGLHSPACYGRNPSFVDRQVTPQHRANPRVIAENAEDHETGTLRPDSEHETCQGQASTERDDATRGQPAPSPPGGENEHRGSTTTTPPGGQAEHRGSTTSPPGGQAEHRGSTTTTRGEATPAPLGRLSTAAPPPRPPVDRLSTAAPPPRPPVDRLSTAAPPPRPPVERMSTAAPPPPGGEAEHRGQGLRLGACLCR
ncbi:unnamed protein product [Arctogadus glacialis]